MKQKDAILIYLITLIKLNLFDQFVEIINTYRVKEIGLKFSFTAYKIPTTENVIIRGLAECKGMNDLNFTAYQGPKDQAKEIFEKLTKNEQNIW